MRLFKRAADWLNEDPSSPAGFNTAERIVIAIMILSEATIAYCDWRVSRSCAGPDRYVKQVGQVLFCRKVWHP